MFWLDLAKRWERSAQKESVCAQSDCLSTQDASASHAPARLGDGGAMRAVLASYPLNWVKRPGGDAVAQAGVLGSSIQPPSDSGLAGTAFRRVPAGRAE